MRLRDPEALRAAMAARSLSQAEVAALAGCSPSFVSHLLPARGRPGARPRKPGCSPERAHALARALRVPVLDLFEPRGKDDPSTGELPLKLAAATRSPAVTR